MNWSLAREATFNLRVTGGATFFPYQLALGLSVRWMSCLSGPAIRLYLGPFKLWMGVWPAPDEGGEEK